MPDFKANDKVSWNSPQGQTHGTIVKKVTSDTNYEGLDITASQDNPRYIVKSAKSGKYAAHKPDSLSKG